MPIITGQDAVPSADHKISDIFTTLTPSIVFVLIFVLFIGLRIFDMSPSMRSFFFNCMRPSKAYLQKILEPEVIDGKSEEMCLNQATYVEALKWKQIDYWIREEVVSCQRLGIEHLKAIAFENLVEADIANDPDGKKAL